MWKHASTTQNLGKPTVELSVNLAVLLFNDGKVATMKRMCEMMNEAEETPRAVEYSKRADRVRMYKSDVRASQVEKKRRKIRARERAESEEASVQREGVTYGAGEF